jgi:hypothetical protein
MGWYETKLYQSAEPQIKATIAAILNDPYLMPPSPLFWPVFEYLAEGETDQAQFHIKGILEDIIWHLHHCIKQLGDDDLPIDLFLFWKQLIKRGESEGYAFFVNEGQYPTGYNHQCGRFAPICIWAAAVYREAIKELKENTPVAFLCMEKEEPTHERRGGSIGEQFLRAIGLESEIPAMDTYLKSLGVEE